MTFRSPIDLFHAVRKCGLAEIVADPFDEPIPYGNRPTSTVEPHEHATPAHLQR
ncbi:MAG: hypothetical protein U0S50_08360 [Sphingopyxis sp.]|uniref:hypothetical protein n=1 Tax=Sphingopyxis sp. TaxID=1908224 RepID=UPI002ABA2FD7|nr:hypothetical protein [Sphingopyxis sp.]MDZ3831813.1 hypothetical protein [Sphingopyxis sp.]